MTRQLFAGCITPAGFIDFFHHIMPVGTAHKRYFLKGASGSGKSTFIKKVAAAITGHDMDFFHCSNDVSSVDGVAIPAIGFSIIDATAPHSHDPELPAAVDEILDFAKFLDAEKVARHRNQIMELTATKKRLYAQAQELLVKAEPDMGTVPCLENHKTQKPSPLSRSFFLSAITPDGIKSFADTTLAYYEVQDIPTGTTLHELRVQALSDGLNTESFHNPLCPTELEALIIPAQGVAYRTNRQIQETAELSQAIAAMQQARATHHKIEEIYIAAMDFAKVNELAEKIIAKIN